MFRLADINSSTLQIALTYYRSIPDYFGVIDGITLPTESMAMLDKVLHMAGSSDCSGQENMLEQFAFEIIIQVVMELGDFPVTGWPDIINKHVGKLKLLGVLGYCNAYYPRLFAQIEEVFDGYMSVSTLAALRALRGRLLGLVKMPDVIEDPVQLIVNYPQNGLHPSPEKVEALMWSLLEHVDRVPEVIGVMTERMDIEPYKSRRRLLIFALAQAMREYILAIEHIEVYAGEHSVDFVKEVRDALAEQENSWIVY